MRSSAIRRTLFLGIIFLIGISFQSENNENVLAQPSMTIGKGPVKAVIPSFSCSYKDITPIFQRNGMPSTSMIKSIEKIDTKYLSLFLYNNGSNQFELHLYDIGNDHILDTLDDRSFLIDIFQLTHFASTDYNFSVTLTPQSGNITNYTLYWVKPLPSGSEEIKSCTLTTQGCANQRIILTVPTYLNLQSMIPSIYQNRIYMVFRDNINQASYPSSSYISCSIQPGTQDNCNNGSNSWIIHTTLGNPFYKTLRGTGFVSRQTIGQVSTTYSTYLFDINYPNQGIVELSQRIHIDSLSSELMPSILAIQQSNNTSLNDSIVLINGLTSTTTLDYLSIPVPSPGTVSIGGESPMIIDTTPSGIVVIYTYNGGRTIIGKRAGGSQTNLIYNYTSPTEPQILPRLVLPDYSIIGYVPSRKSIIQFECKP